jgi:hypothetical protein
MTLQSYDFIASQQYRADDQKAAGDGQSYSTSSVYIHEWNLAIRFGVIPTSW